MPNTHPPLSLPASDQVVYNDAGFNEWGYNIDGYDERGFNSIGFNEQGYNDLGHNINGYTFAQQEAYEAYVTVHPEYQPEQTIRQDDRYWGILRDNNSYLICHETAYYHLAFAHAAPQVPAAQTLSHHVAYLPVLHIIVA